MAMSESEFESDVAIQFASLNKQILNCYNFFSFVMGEKTASLRGKRLSDLIHGASINRPVRTYKLQ